MICLPFPVHVKTHLEWKDTAVLLFSVMQFCYLYQRSTLMWLVLIVVFFWALFASLYEKYK